MSFQRFQRGGAREGCSRGEIWTRRDPYPYPRPRTFRLRNKSKKSNTFESKIESPRLQVLIASTDCKVFVELGALIALVGTTPVVTRTPTRSIRLTSTSWCTDELSSIEPLIESNQSLIWHRNNTVFTLPITKKKKKKAQGRDAGEQWTTSLRMERWSGKRDIQYDQLKDWAPF